MSIGTIGKAAGAIAGRVGASMVGGPIGTAIGVASTVPLLIDLVRSFMSGGEDNVDPNQIKAARDKVMGEMQKGGMAPEEARAKVDELLHPFVNEVEHDREKPSAVESLLKASLAVGGVMAGRKYNKSAAAKGATAKGAPHDTVHDAQPMPGKGAELADEKFNGAVKPKPYERTPHTNGDEDHLSDGFDRRPSRSGEYDAPDLSDGYARERGFSIPHPDGGTAPMSTSDLERMAVMHRLRSEPRRPQSMIPQGEDTSAMPRLGYDEDAARAAVAERANREADRRRIDLDTVDANMEGRKRRHVRDAYAYRERDI